MKKLIIVIILISNIYNLYAYENFIISDSSLKILRDAGINVSDEMKYNINLIAKKYSNDAKKVLFEIHDIDIKLNNEYKKVDVNLDNIKKLIFEKKQKEADFDYIIMSCDLDILSLFSDNDIKRIKYYIIFKK